MRRCHDFLLASRLLGFTMVLAAAGPAAAQTDALGPRLQDATIVGRGNTIIIKRLPVHTPNGVVYRNLTIELKLDESGGVNVSASTPAAPAAGRAGGVAAPAAAPVATIAHEVAIGAVSETAATPEVEAPFVAGFYRDVESGGIVHVIKTGRAIEPAGLGVASAEFPSWALSVFGGDVSISAAHWYAGPIRTNPNKRLVELAGTTDDQYSYGAVDADGGGAFGSGMLIGAKQTGDTLTIVGFHKSGCCTYSSTPTAQLTFVRIKSR